MRNIKHILKAKQLLRRECKTQVVSTNILVEVEESVYSMVVLPHKKSKTFSKLVASLMQGYVEDEYIRAYVEGTLSTMQKAAVNSLDGILGNMTQSLANMGLYTKEMQNNSKKGFETFNGKGKEEQLLTPAVVNTEVEELKDDISMLKKQNEEILNLLRSGNFNQKSESTSVEARTKLQKKETKPINLEIEDFIPKLSLVEDSRGDTFAEPEINAEDALSSLLVGNSYVF